MRILHYTLGLPPYRTGGLTKYSYDLIKEQIKNNNDVFLLFPGKISFFNGNNITSKIKYYGLKDDIKVYEIINPLPVPLLNGICNPNEFMKATDKKFFKKFLENIRVDIVHIHTLMGLHKEFLEVCSEMKIKIIYTTHDYFGLCPKVNFLDYKGNVCEEATIEKCSVCNSTGYSMKTIKILQSAPYRYLKNKDVIPKIKKIALSIKGNKKVEQEYYKEEIIVDKSIISDYEKLNEYYKEMFSYVDKFIFNSSVTSDIYSKSLKCKGEVAAVTHKDINDNRRIKNFSEEKLKIAYLGPDKKYKGFFDLLSAVNEVNKKYNDGISLYLYGKIEGNYSHTDAHTKGSYAYSKLEEIFDEIDLVIVPSIWYETFGFVTLEAMSHGVPVIVTNNVGSKDILNDGRGIIIEDSEEALKNILIDILKDRNILVNINKNISKYEFKYTINNHYDEINKFYKDEILDE